LYSKRDAEFIFFEDQRQLGTAENHIVDSGPIPPIMSIVFMDITSSGNYFNGYSDILTNRKPRFFNSGTAAMIPAPVPASG